MIEQLLSINIEIVICFKKSKYHADRLTTCDFLCYIRLLVCLFGDRNTITRQPNATEHKGDG